MSAALSGCADKKALPEVQPTPEVVVTPQPTPEPTPFPEPQMEKGGAVTFDGTELPDGSFEKDGIQYVLLSEAAEALGGVSEGNGETFTLSWYRGELSFKGGTDGIPCHGGEDLYVPVEDFCRSCSIGMLYDDEYDHLYCTASAGEWDIPQGYTCPVFMYHSVGKNSAGVSTICVKTENLEEQFKYLLENGYSPIWFEDIDHIEDYERPVILMFDDGWRDNYTELWPLVERYQVKVTICPVPAFTDVSHHHLTSDMIHEMCQSEYIRFESHTYKHGYLDQMTSQEQYDELVDSRLWITRMTGRQPIVLCYPTGITTDYVQRLIRDDHIYRFGVKMLGYESYNTSDDPSVVWRFYPERTTTLYDYASWLKSAFKIIN